jgi:formate hydrogenlyase transcriptional activator
MQPSKVQPETEIRQRAVTIAWPAPAANPVAEGEDADRKVQDLERVISITLARFVDLPADRIDAEIIATLRLIVELCGFDRCSLLLLTDDKSEARATHAYHAEGIEAAPQSCAFRSCFPWTCENILQGLIVCVSRLGEMPPEAALDRQRLESIGVQSFLAIPIYLADSVKYFLAAHQVGSSKSWREESILLLSQAGEVFVHALERLRNERVGVLRLQFDRLISDLSISFLNVAPERLDAEIAAALRQIRTLLQFDRLAVAAITPEQGEVVMTHCCHGEVDAAAGANTAVTFPAWAREKLTRGDPIWFTDPGEATPDTVSLGWLGEGAVTLAIPIRVQGRAEFLLAAADRAAGRQLINSLVSQLRLVGEILANALVRRKLETECTLSGVEIERLKGKLQLESQYPQQELMSSQRHEQIIGQSAQLMGTLLLAEKVAPTDSTVLVSGETGTGKELIAQVIHGLGARRNKPMVKVNCASLPAALVESELFGREKGAYTGALTRQSGRFEIADGGTIFLDEIAEMPLELQAKLLRVLQEGEFERLGSTKTIKVDVRVIAATNRNLAEEVKNGRFREDLYYRINVFQIVVPPLRERVEDIPLLVWSFLNEFGEKMGKKINKIAKQEMTALQRYSWPGNVRELRNVIEHAVIVAADDRLQVRLPAKVGDEECGIVTLAECENRHIREILRLTNGRIKGKGGAAELLGLNPSTLYSRMQKSGIATRIPGKDEISP